MISWKKRQYSTKKLYLCSLNNKKVVFYTFKMGQLQERYKSYREPQKFMAKGVYPYFRAITSKQGPLHWEPEVNSMTEVVVDLEKKFKQCVGE